MGHQEQQAPGGSIPIDYSEQIDQRRPMPPRVVIPKPFDIMVVTELLIALNTPTWLDPPTAKLPGRRAWAVLNTDPVAGNNIWVAGYPMTAIGQGGRVLAQGGSLSVPGSELMNVNVFTNVAAGVTICFYQFA